MTTGSGWVDLLILLLTTAVGWLLRHYGPMPKPKDGEPPATALVPPPEPKTPPQHPMTLPLNRIRDEVAHPN